MSLSRSNCAALSLCALLSLIAATALAESPKRGLPAPTGKSPIGRVTYYWTDETRDEKGAAVDTQSNERRELRVDVWYPAQPAATDAAAAYCADIEQLRKPLGPGTFLWSSLTTHAFTGAAIAPGASKYPVILFTPGHSMNAFEYTALIEELVSHGYVVAGVDHPLQSGAVAYPDGRVALLTSRKDAAAEAQSPVDSYRDRVEIRSADLRFVLDKLTSLDADKEDPRFAGRLDLARVGVLGHSLGGVAAAEACQDDPRFKAALNMDGHAQSLPFFPDKEGRGPRQPFMELTDAGTQPTDKQLAQWKVTREEFERQSVANSERVAKAMRTIAGGSFRVTIPDARHQTFADTAIWDHGTADQRERRIQMIRDYARAFFDKVLLGRRDTLLDAETWPYSDVLVERYQPGG